MADKISFSDLFDLSNSSDLKKAIKLISDMDKVYEKLADGIKKESNAIEKALKENAKAAKELQTSYSALSKGAGKTKEATKEYVTQSEKLYYQQQELSKQQKVAIKNLDKLKKEQDDVNKSAKKATDLDKERVRLMDKLNKANGKQAKGTAILKEAIREKNKQVKEAARESLGLISVYQKESKRLNDLRKRYKDVALTQGKSSKAAKSLAKQVQTLDTRLKSVDASAGQFQRNVGNYPQIFKSAVVGITAGIVAVTGFVRAVGRAIKITRDYQDANAVLAGILGTTVSKTETLRRQQLELGKSTEFSASQVAKAQTELARLGQSQENIIAMTPGILSAATALGTDLASAAELVAGQLNAFGLEASQSQEVADVLTKSTQISALNFERLSTALAIVSPAANAVNVTIEETTAILGAAADANIDASTAATALRNIYIDLSDKGISWDEAMNQLNNSTNKLSTANELFGKRGAVVATVIASQTEKIEKNTKSLQNASGAAERFAKGQLDTLTGDVKLLSSAWEGFILSIENGNGVIGKALRAILKGFTTLLGNLTEDLPKAENSLVSINREFNNQITILKQGNLTTEARKKLIDDINDQYGEYLPNLIDEKASLQELDKIQKEVNNNLLNRILLQEQEQEIAKFQRIRINNQKQLLELEIALEDAIIRQRKAQSPQQSQAIQSEIDNNISLQKILTAEIEYAEQQLLKLNESYAELAERLGINTKSYKENTNATKENNDALRTQIFILGKALNSQELLAKKLEEVNGIYKVVFGETIDESQKRFEDANQSFIDGVSEQINARAEQYRKEREEAERTARLVAEYEERKKQNYIDTAYAGVDAINSLFARRQQAVEEELNLLQQETDRKLELAAENEEGQQIIRQRTAERERELQRQLAEERRKQAIFNKSVAIAEIAINTALGITKSIAQLGLPAAIPFVISAGILGAAQAAAVIAEPIPAFAKGTDNSPEGLAWVGEEGREIVVRPSGEAYVTPDKPTLVDLEGGSQVLTNAISENILKGNDPVQANSQSNNTLRDVIGTRITAENQARNMATLVAKENDILMKQLKKMSFNQPVNQFYFEDGDLKTAIKKGNTTIKNAKAKYTFKG